MPIPAVRQAPCIGQPPSRRPRVGGASLPSGWTGGASMRLVISGSFTGVVVRDGQTDAVGVPGRPGVCVPERPGVHRAGTGGAGSRYRSEVTPWGCYGPSVGARLPDGAARLA